MFFYFSGKKSALRYPAALQIHVIVVVTMITPQRFLVPTHGAQLRLFNPCASGGADIRNGDVTPHIFLGQSASPFWNHISVLQSFFVVYMEDDKQLELRELVEVIPGVLSLRYSSNSGTSAKCIKIARQFFAVMNHFGVEYLSDLTPEFLDDFYWMPSRRHGYQEPSSATAANRQWAVRTMFDVFREMGLWDGTDISGETISREYVRSSRPAIKEELRHIQVVSRNVLIPNGDELLVALALCGGSASEIAAVCTEDIDLVSHTIQFTGASQRLNNIDEWSFDVLSEAVTKIPESTRMVVRPGLAPQRAAHSVTVRLNRLITQAGFSTKNDLTGVSIRLGAARAVLDTDGLEVAATFLGNQSLDATAKALRYEWWVRS